MQGLLMAPHSPFTLLLSTYDLGRRPMALALVAGWFQQADQTIHCLDLSVQPLDETLATRAACVAVYLPMHTATRLAARVLPRLKALNPKALLVCWGLYALPNQAWLRQLGATHVLGVECEPQLLALAQAYAPADLPPATNPAPMATNLAQTAPTRLPKLKHPLSAQAGLPAPQHYATLTLGNAQHYTASVETTRGCKHTCTHCPLTPIYQGQLRVVAPRVIAHAIDVQVEAGASHVTFADPDFLNAPTHALNTVRAMQQRHPNLTYDATIKVEHLLKHANLLPILRNTGCVLITTAVESFEAPVLQKLQKNHTPQQAVQAIKLLRSTELGCNPTFVPFTPWSTLAGISHLLQWVQRLGLVDLIAPVQYGIRLLLPKGSPLLQEPDVQPWLLPFDAAQLHTPWRSPDTRLDALQTEFAHIAQRAQSQNNSRQHVFAALQKSLHAWATPAELRAEAQFHSRGCIPNSPPLGVEAWQKQDPWVLNARLSEPWFC